MHIARRVKHSSDAQVEQMWARVRKRVEPQDGQLVRVEQRVVVLQRAQRGEQERFSKKGGVGVGEGERGERWEGVWGERREGG